MRYPAGSSSSTIADSQHAGREGPAMISPGAIRRFLLSSRPVSRSSLNYHYPIRQLKTACQAIQSNPFPATALPTSPERSDFSGQIPVSPVAMTESTIVRKSLQSVLTANLGPRLAEDPHLPISSGRPRERQIGLARPADSLAPGRGQPRPLAGSARLSDGWDRRLADEHASASLAEANPAPDSNRVLYPLC